jgi:hypothetical protein
MEQLALELYLPHLSMVELMGSPEHYSIYQEAVVAMLSVKDLYVWEDDVLKFNQKRTMEEVVAINEVRYVSAGEKKREGELVNAWYDTWAEYFITLKDPLYSLFFTYKLRQIDLLDMDDFLNYQLEQNYENNFTRFSRFLSLTLRKYAKKILEPEHELTADEWIKQKQEEIKQDSSTGEKKGKLKGRPQRSSDDKLTVLNQEQTVLLIHYLQKSKMIFQGDFLKSNQAGQAFHILTGFSADTIRQKLGDTELKLINTKKNLTDLDNAFAKIRILIANDLKPKK